MSNRLEQFVKDNREEFDKFEPGPVVWHNIQQDLKKLPAKKQGILISMAVLKWSAAAAVIILVGAGIWFFTNNTGKNNNLAQTDGIKQVTPKTTDTPLLAKEDPSQQSVVPQQKEEPAVATSDYDQEMYHYAKLVEIKQNQIKQIKKEEPLLYQKFAGDINKLDSAFHTLKKQLPVNPNREQLLEAMIDNLKMQEAVLNQQLNIIKQINQVKKSEYEKAYKSI
jgi:hypothetical protein